MPRVPVVFVNRLGRKTAHRPPLNSMAKTMQNGLPVPKHPETPYKSDEREVEAGAAAASDNLIHPVFKGFVGNRAAVEALSIQLRYVGTNGYHGD